MRIAWFSPLNDRGLRRSALYSQEVLRHLPCDVELFLDDDELRFFEGKELPFPAFHFLRIAERDEAQPFDVFVYNIEDHPSTLFCKHAAALYPGIVVFHDLELSRMSPEKDTVAKLLCEASVAIVKNAHGLYDEQIQRSKVPAYVTANPISTSMFPERGAAREKLQLKEGTFAICFTASVPLEDRLFAVLDGAPQRTHWLLFSAHERRFAEQFLARRSANVELLDVFTFDALRSILPAFDLLVAPKFDVRRDMSIALPLAWAAGVPTIGLDFGPATELPNDMMLRIHPGRGEAKELTLAIKAVSEDANLRATLCTSARRYVELVCDPVLVVADLLAILSEQDGLMRDRLAAKREIYRVATKHVLTKAERELGFAL